MIDTKRAKSFSSTLQMNKILDDRYEFKKPSIRTEYGIMESFFSDSWARDMTQTTCTPAMISAGTCEEYMEFVYEISDDVVITTRSYTKITKLLGEFGGILKLLTSFLIVFSLYYSRSIRSFLIEKIFPMKKGCFEELNKRIQEKKDTERRLEEPKPKPKKVPKVVQKMTGKVVDSRTDAVELMKKLNFVDILESSIFKKHHKILLPLALVKSKQMEEKRTESLTEMELGEGFSRVDKSGKKYEFSDYLKAYNRLKSAENGNSIKELFNNKMVDYLGDMFESGDENRSN